MLLVALVCCIAMEFRPTDNTLKRTEDLLDYAATHLNAKVRYRASDMVLQIHTDASYPSDRRHVAAPRDITSLDGSHTTINQ